jgi:ESS family glutamate:Na+ symporter
MSSASLTELMYCFCVLSVLLLLGAFLRGVIPIFRKLFLPASVIGGFIGLLVGPVIWGEAGLPFPKEWISTWAALPGILIVPVVASVPLGMKFGGGNTSAGKTSSDIIKMFGVMLAICAVQMLAGLFVRQFFTLVQPDLNLYPTFGFELSQGFSGGHGTAGVIGSFYKGLDLPYWELAQGVTTTTATFGLVGGMIIGIVAINVAARRGKTAILKKPGDIPLDMGKGFQRDASLQKSLGNETTYNSSIESLSFHMAIILAGCGLAYIFMNAAKANKIPGLMQIPIWAYAIVVMFGVNFAIQKAGLGSLIDGKSKSRIAGVCSDYAITAAVASMPVHAILQYIAPILVMVAIGYVLTYAVSVYLCAMFFTDCKFERAMAVLGTCTGVFLTGLLLLKICDPDYELPVLNDYSVGFSLTSVSSFMLLPITVNLMLQYGFGANLAYQAGILAVALILIVFANRFSKRSAY